jgi:hypothetical protein
MEISYICDTCQRPVEFENAFLRSVNLRTVAWCRACWFARHSDLIPQQRQGSTSPERTSRWRLTRR